MTHKNYIPILAALSLSALAVAPVTAHAQKKLPRVSMYLRDVPVRTALTQVFNKVGVQHAIDPQITGSVTLRIRNQSFENAVKLILRSATTPVAYTREANVYIVKVRPVAPAIDTRSNVASNEEEQPYAPNWNPYAYVDPYYSNPVPRGPIVMGGSGGFGMNNPITFGAGGSNIFLGNGGFGGFSYPYVSYPYWSIFGNYGLLNGGNFGGLNAGNSGTFGSFGVINNGNYGNNFGAGNFGGMNFGLRGF